MDLVDEEDNFLVFDLSILQYTKKVCINIMLWIGEEWKPKKK